MASKGQETLKRHVETASFYLSICLSVCLFILFFILSPSDESEGPGT